MNAIEKLQAERQRLVARISEIDKILGQFEELQRMAESFFSVATTNTDSREKYSDSAAPSTDDSGQIREFSMPDRFQPTKPKTPMAEFMNIVLQILAGAEQPLDRSALYAELLNRGVVIGSPDESSDLNTLSARMSRMTENVTNVKGYGYWLKDREFRQGGYHPTEVASGWSA